MKKQAVMTSKALALAGVLGLSSLQANQNLIEKKQQNDLAGWATRFKPQATNIDKNLNLIAKSEQTIVSGWTPALFLDASKGKGFIYIHRPQDDKIETLMYTKDSKVARFIWWNYNSCKKADFKYIPDRAGVTILRKGLEAVYVLPTENSAYKGDPLADEYKQGMPMSWQCDTIDDFRHFAVHLIYKTQPTETKPKLLLSIKKDPTFASLTDKDKAFIATYFTLPSSAEEIEDLKGFFAENRKTMRDKVGDVNGAGPEAGYDTISEVLYASLVKRASDFDERKAVPKLFDYLANDVTKTIGQMYISAKFLHFLNLK
jgi:hypothetical protein